MGATKTDVFTVRQNTIAAIAKALGHPARVSIIEYLVKVNSCIAGDIVKELPLSQPTVSQHLKELKSAGLIDGYHEANTIKYYINEKTLREFGQYFSGVAAK